MQEPSKRQIKAISAATRRYCSTDGRGNVVTVWKDYSYCESVSAQTDIARKLPNGDREDRLECFTSPCSPEMVAQQLAADLAWIDINNAIADLLRKNHAQD